MTLADRSQPSPYGVACRTVTVTNPALLQTGTHFFFKPAREGADDVHSLLMGEHRDVGSTYYKTLVTAFLGAHSQGQSQYLP